MPLAADVSDDARPPPPVPSSAGSLAAIPPALLRSDPALAALVGAADATVAVPEAGPGGGRWPRWPPSPSARPLLVVTATGLDAERLADDLGCLHRDRRATAGDGVEPVIGALAGPVTVLPAWETLPFERVSPEIETMGRRLAVLARAARGRPTRRSRRRPG